MLILLVLVSISLQYLQKNVGDDAGKKLADKHEIFL